jgi:hypothetical protein
MKREKRMETRVINHSPHRLAATVLRTLEFGSDCPQGPADVTELVAHCHACSSLMSYRGQGTLRNGTHVHYFECVHSPREVHGQSFVIA